VRAAFLQNLGIGRGMKVGKESVVGTIAALEAWEKRDHAAVRAREQRHLDLWIARLKDLPGVRAEVVPDPTANPLDRVKLSVDPREARITAWDLADVLARGAPPIIVRDHEAEHGFFYLDPCNLHDGEAELVAERLAAELARARAGNGPPGRSYGERRRARIAGLLRWPD
jgi:D-glucosaminate-6-phosphate ammonia-lyase